MKIPGHLRTIRSKTDYCGHDFEKHELCLVKRDGTYFLEHWIDPMPGGMGVEFREHALEISEETAQGWSDELLAHYTRYHHFP